MNNRYKKGAASIVFGLASIGLTSITAVAEEPPAIKPDKFDYLPLSAADIHIPAYNQQHLPDGRVQFDINLKDFSRLRLLFARTLGFFYANHKPSLNQACPHVRIPEKQVSKEYRNNGIIRVTIAVDKTIIDAATRQGCVIASSP